ncbi:hypothetical protein ALC62_11878 [Cyphomyrmex costatus]|uniref:Uncharacterized protein n=1 Tax=Cyphomyrmex costatus TaxID=456900 RepID=A0A195C9P4_9HYME|nr:hypothetical protein ALC62_11878 [Cyphomyrmex costatus]
MAELKAAPLFGSVRLQQRLTRGYTTARTPVSPAASAFAVAASSPAATPRRYPCVYHGVQHDGCTACRENKVPVDGVRCSRSSPIVKPSRPAQISVDGKRPPAYRYGPEYRCGHGCGLKTRVTRAHSVQVSSSV